MESHWNAHEVMRYIKGEREKQLPNYNSLDPITQAANKKHIDEQTRHHTEYAKYSNIYLTGLQAGPADGIHFNIDIDGSKGYNEAAAKMNHF